jgi:hypothetical protein
VIGVIGFGGVYLLDGNKHARKKGRRQDHVGKLLA